MRDSPAAEGVVRLSFPSTGRRVRSLVVTALLSALALAAAPAARAAAGDTGRVHVMQSAESDFDD